MIDQSDPFDPMPHLSRLDGQLVNRQQISMMRGHASVMQR